MTSHRPWLPDTDPATGELHSVAGASEKVYWNGSPHPVAQKYVYLATARNLPKRLLWEDVAAAAQQVNEDEEPAVPGEQPSSNGEAEAAPIAVAERVLAEDPFPLVPRQPTYREPEVNHFSNLQLFENYGAPFNRPLSYLTQTPTFLQPPPPSQIIRRPREPQQRHYSPHSDPVEAVWQRLHQIYGTAVGILIKSLDFESEVSSRNRNYLFEDMFFQEHNLPRPLTRQLMDLCSSDTRYQVYLGRVIRGERRPRELRDVVKNGVSSREWPGSDSFSELRNGFETVRNKAKAFLTTYSAQFDAAWEAWRSRRNNGRF